MTVGVDAGLARAAGAQLHIQGARLGDRRVTGRDVGIFTGCCSLGNS